MLRQRSKVQQGLLAWHFISHSRGQMCFTEVNHHQMLPFKPPKCQLRRYWWKFQFSLETQTPVQPISLVKARVWWHRRQLELSPVKPLWEMEHWWVQAAILGQAALGAPGDRRVSNSLSTLQSRCLWLQDRSSTRDLQKPIMLFTEQQLPCTTIT